MKKTVKLSQNEEDLFKNEMKGVNPLKQGDYVTLRKIKSNVPRHNASNASTNASMRENSSAHYLLSDAQDHQYIQSDEFISYACHGVQQKTLKKLRAGKIPIEARLDLHGSTIDQARHDVSEFLVICQEMQKKCVIIIHGKGTMNKSAILKSMLNHWLPQIPDVLAFSSTQAQHGGRGAVYILIKTKLRP